VWSGSQGALLARIGAAPPTRANPMALALTAAWFWALLTPVLMWFTRRLHDRVASWPARIAAHAGAFLVVHLVDASVYAVASRLVAGIPRPVAPLLLTLVTFNLLTYGVVVATVAALDSRATLRARRVREAQLETQLALARFHALRAQLHPHFLFNALNAISSLLYTDPRRADRMLAEVSALLRMAVDSASRPEVPLVDELAFARRYLEVEAMRYGDRLDVRVDVPGETYDALVPNMLLQPLVENAVRHGIAPHAGRGRVAIRAAREGGRLSIVVSDTGHGIDDALPGDDGASGVGLRTTRARLRTLYGDAQELALVNVPGGFETRVTLPLRWRGEVA
jgi:sensor histidine kinase YesM